MEKINNLEEEVYRIELNKLKETINEDILFKYNNILQKFISLSINNLLPNYLGRFNMKNFDVDKNGFSKKEFEQYLHTLYNWLQQLLKTKSLEKLEKVYEEMKNVHWYDWDLFLAQKAKNFANSEIMTINWWERILKLLNNISEKKLEKIKKKKFNINNLDSIWETLLLIWLNIPEAIQGTLTFILDLVPAIILIPRYLYYLSKIDEDLIYKIKLEVLEEDNIVFKLFSQLRDRDIDISQIAKNLINVVTNWTQQEVASFISSLFVLIWGWAWLIKIFAEIKKLDGLWIAAWRVLKFSEKVDSIINSWWIWTVVKKIPLKSSVKIKKFSLLNFKKIEKVLWRSLTEEDKQIIKQALDYAKDSYKRNGYYSFFETFRKYKILSKNFSSYEIDLIMNHWFVWKLTPAHINLIKDITEHSYKLYAGVSKISSIDNS